MVMIQGESRMVRSLEHGQGLACVNRHQVSPAPLVLSGMPSGVGLLAGGIGNSASRGMSSVPPQYLNTVLAVPRDSPGIRTPAPANSPWRDFVQAGPQNAAA